MKSHERIIQKLREARALVEQGWCQYQGKIITEEGKCLYCPIGALYAVKEDQSFYYAIGYLGRVIDPVHWYESGVVPQWNDDPIRTKEDVLAAFDMAIDLAWAHAKEFPSELQNDCGDA